MSESFRDQFRFDVGQVAGVPWADARLTAVLGYEDLAHQFAGCSVDAVVAGVQPELRSRFPIVWSAVPIRKVAG